MYRIDPQTNRIEPLEVKTFSELGFTERTHLQEWLAYFPKALGEDLLVIQKEFDGFDGTRELDLLALDKDGRIVVIENKLDDSGSDVVWQALKYASYCSAFKKDQIVGVFQQHLNRHHGGGDARQILREFFDGRDIEELKLNPGNEQRIILVAANFRKEVTSTALWLLGYNVRLQCFKVTPFERGGEFFLNVDQIIPTPEVAAYMIGLADKEVSLQVDEAEVKQRHRLRINFWTQALEAVRKSNCRLFDNVSPSERSKAGTGSGISSVWYEMVFGFSEARVQLYLDRRDAAENKTMFDQLMSQRELIEDRFGAKLQWNRMADLKGAQVQYIKEFNGRDQDEWPEMIVWLSRHIGMLEVALREPLQLLQRPRLNARL